MTRLVIATASTLVMLLTLAGCADDNDPAPDADQNAEVTETPTDPPEPTESPEDISADELSRQLVQALGQVETMRAVTTQSTIDSDATITVITTAEVDQTTTPATSRTFTDCEGERCEDAGYQPDETPGTIRVGDDVYDWWDDQWIPSALEPGQPSHELDATVRLAESIKEIVSATPAELEDGAPATTYDVKVARPVRHMLAPDYTLQITVGDDWLVREIVRVDPNDGLFGESSQTLTYDVDIEPIEAPAVG